MARYIDAEEIEYMKIPLGEVVFDGVAFKEDIDKMPTADVVDIVRCRDCIYYDRTERCNYHYVNEFVGEDDYCSRGERKDEK